jgi:cob(I)alamin adenosyltransferase
MIYTRTGDDGSTGISKGERVLKTDVRIQAVGSLDELNASIGILLSLKPNEFLQQVQNDIFEIGAEITTGISKKDLYISKIKLIEERIDKFQKEMPSLRNFILPGGSIISSYCHSCRTICRRAERDCVALLDDEYISQHAIMYLNRLSDLFFVEARYENNKGKDDVLWRRC